MRLLVHANAMVGKYGDEAAEEIQAALERIAPVVDVSGCATKKGIINKKKLRELIEELPTAEAVCLVGGYDLIPAEKAKNPIAGEVASDPDKFIYSDTPYVATRSANPRQRFCLQRPISRLPDLPSLNGSRARMEMKADPEPFLRLIESQDRLRSQATPPTSFEACAGSFRSPAKQIGNAMRGTCPRYVWPPEQGFAAVHQEGLSGSGRIHMLLHGCGTPEKWHQLFGQDRAEEEFQLAFEVQAMTVAQVHGAIATLSCCYGGMLDTGNGKPGRTPADQVALALLYQGAKAVIGATRANWVEEEGSLGPGGPLLIVRFWEQLHRGLPVAEALKAAKAAIADEVESERYDLPFTQKAHLQFECFGLPEHVLCP